MCLQYVRETFGLPIRYGSATEAWNNSPSQHQDWNFPPGLWVPIWFSIDIEPNGHVALLAPDGTVYSSSDNGSIPHHHPSIADLINYYAYWGKMTLTLLGWSEDVAGYPVVSLTADTINFQSTPTVKDWLDMATIDDVRAVVREALQEQWPDAEGTPTSLKDVTYILRSLVHDVPNTVLKAPVARGGKDVAGNASLAGVVAYFDQSRIDLQNTVPGAVLNAQFKLADGTVTNLAGILSAINAKPVTATAAASVDVDALVARLKAELPPAILADLAAQLIK
jgi:hypothetical protein